MTAHEYLSQARYLYQRIESLKRDLFYLEQLASGTQSQAFDLPRVDKTPSGKPIFVSYIDKILKKEEQIDKEVKKLLDLETELSNVIEEINDPQLEFILKEHYLLQRTYVDIADDLHVTENWVYKLRQKALSLVKVPTIK